MKKIDSQAVEMVLKDIRQLIDRARSQAAQRINTLQLITNFEIGRLIVEREQNGEKRATYGKNLIVELSKKLRAEYGRGFSERNLDYMRKFFLMFKDDFAEIPQKASAEFIGLLSWSHYVYLMGIKDAACRRFYEIESVANSWSLPELNRQFNSSLFERLALSRDKQGIKELSEKGQLLTKPRSVGRNHVAQGCQYSRLGISAVSTG